MSSTWTETFYLTEWLPPRIYIKNQLNLSLSSEKKRKLFLLSRMGDASHVSIWIGFKKKRKKKTKLGHTLPAIPRDYLTDVVSCDQAALNGQKKFLFVRRISDSTASECIHQLATAFRFGKSQKGRAGRSAVDSRQMDRPEYFSCAAYVLILLFFFCSRRDNVPVVRPSTF